MVESTFDTIADFYATNVEELRMFANKLLNDTEEAKDVVQQCFVRLLCMKQTIIPDTLNALAHDMVRKSAISLLRRKATARRYYEAETANTPSTYDCLEARIAAKDLAQMAAQEISRLPEKCRSIYEMSLYEGMKVGEIASALHIKYKYAEKQLGTARKTIRESLRNVV